MTPRQARFAEEYLKDLNGRQAAIRTGCPEKNAEAQASKWLANPKVSARIDQLRAERSRKTGIDAAWLLDRLSQEATADLADLYFENGALKPVSEWPLIWRQGLVAGVKHVEVKDHEGNATGDVIVDVKLSDRVRRLELIGKHIGVRAFEETSSGKGIDALADRLARAMRRDDGKA